MVAIGVSGAVVASAATPSLSDDPTSGPPGTAFTVTGTGFCPSATAGCTTVTIQLNGTVIRRDVQVGADGSFQTQLGAGGGTGSVLILATQNNDAIQARTFFTVTPGASPPPQQTTPLPATPPASTPKPSTGPPVSPAAPNTATPSAASATPVMATGSRGSGGSGGSPPTLVIVVLVAAAVAALALAVYAVRRLRAAPR